MFHYFQYFGVWAPRNGGGEGAGGAANSIFFFAPPPATSLGSPWPPNLVSLAHARRDS